MATNKEKIIVKLKTQGRSLGCWDEKLELLNPRWLKIVSDNAEFGNDTDVCIDKKRYVVEIDIVDNEVDFSLLSKSKYISMYGNERYSKDNN